LADRIHVDGGRHLFAVAALQQRGDAAREFDVLQPALDLARRVGQHLAVLRRHDARQLGLALLEELADPEEDVGALRQRRGAPRGEGVEGRGDGRVHFLGRGEVDLVRLPAGRGIEDGTGATR
jgi:hypothetical protein